MQNCDEFLETFFFSAGVSEEQLVLVGRIETGFSGFFFFCRRLRAAFSAGGQICDEFLGIFFFCRGLRGTISAGGQNCDGFRRHCGTAVGLCVGFYFHWPLYLHP